MTCHLDGCFFSAGALSQTKNQGSGFGMLSEAIYNKKTINPDEKLVAIHANYISSNHNKMEALKGFNFWATTSSSNTILVQGNRRKI